MRCARVTRKLSCSCDPLTKLGEGAPHRTNEGKIDKPPVALRWRPSTIWEMKSHRPPFKRWATKDGMGGRRCSWGLITIRRARCQDTLADPGTPAAHLLGFERLKIRVGFDPIGARK